MDIVAGLGDLHSLDGVLDWSFLSLKGHFGAVSLF
jgi:hypothetical protein